MFVSNTKLPNPPTPEADWNTFNVISCPVTILVGLSTAKEAVVNVIEKLLPLEQSITNNEPVNPLDPVPWDEVIVITGWEEFPITLNEPVIIAEPVNGKGFPTGAKDADKA